MAIWHKGIMALVLVGCAACSRPNEPVEQPQQSPEEEQATGLDSAIDPPPGMTNDWVSTHYRERTAMFDQRTVAPGGMVMLGDSITEWTDWEALLPGQATINFGIAGDIAEGVYKRLRQVEAADPDTVLLMIGTNDLGQGRSPEEIGDSVEKILDELLTYVDRRNVYVQSVLPREPAFADRVIALNQRLEHEAYMRGMYYVYLHDAFLDEAGKQLDPALTEDGLHLNEAGYEKWATILRPYLDKFPIVPGTNIVIPAHYPPGGKTRYAQVASVYEEREVPPGRIAFVGDSITEGGDWARLFPELETVNFGIGWDQTSGLLNRLEQIERAEPERIVLLIGTNDIGDGRPVSEAADNIREIIREMKDFIAAEDILLQSVMPREAERNGEVLELNARIERIAGEEEVSFLDLYEPLVIEDHLDPSITEDSLHLTEAGYQRWRVELAPWLGTQ